MKKIIIMMMVLMTFGIVWAYDAVAVVENNTSRLVTFGIAFRNTNDYQQVTTTTAAVNFLGWSGLPYDIIAVIGTDINIRIPGYYQTKTRTLLPGGPSNNIVSFEFSNLNPVDPGDPGQNQ